MIGTSRGWNRLRAHATIISTKRQAGWYQLSLIASNGSDSRWYPATYLQQPALMYVSPLNTRGFLTNYFYIRYSPYSPIHVYLYNLTNIPHTFILNISFSAPPHTYICVITLLCHFQLSHRWFPLHQFLLTRICDTQKKKCQRREKSVRESLFKLSTEVVAWLFGKINCFVLRILWSRNFHSTEFLDNKLLV